MGFVTIVSAQKLQILECFRACTVIPIPDSGSTRILDRSRAPRSLMTLVNPQD